jgi:hypothetical protein
LRNILRHIRGANQNERISREEREVEVDTTSLKKGRPTLILFPKFPGWTGCLLRLNCLQVLGNRSLISGLLGASLHIDRLCTRPNCIRQRVPPPGVLRRSVFSSISATAGSIPVSIDSFPRTDVARGTLTAFLHPSVCSICSHLPSCVLGKALRSPILCCFLAGEMSRGVCQQSLTGYRQLGLT